MWTRGLLVMCTAGSLLGAAGACSHNEPSMQSQSGSSWEQAKESFASAYDSVKSGAQQSATAGKYALTGVGQGAVRVTKTGTQAVASTGQSAGQKAGDAYITSKIKSRYAFDKDIKMGQIDVDTDRGVVRLSGTVDTERAAERAIDVALGTKGVVAVDSELTFKYVPVDRPPGGPI